MNSIGKNRCTGIAASLAALLALCWGAAAFAEDNNAPPTTYAQDVAPILNQKCASCHRPGEIAPMSLLTYDDARPWAKSIRKSVANREMPPWKADPAHGTFRNAIRLSDAEVATFTNWVDQGAPSGDLSKAPAPPKFTEGWQLGEPDYIIELPEVSVPAQGPDLFPNLDAKIAIPEARWIRAVEVRPGDRHVTHHLVVFSGSFGGAQGVLPDFLAVWALGTPPAVYPEGMGRSIRPNTSVRVNMHYHPNGTASKDRSRIGLYFGTGELKKEINGQFAGTISFAIPPGAKDYKISAKYIVDDDIDIVSLFPHMHMRGKSMKYTASFPDGHKDVLLSVPAYDFNWQWFYYPDKPLRLPKGTRIDIDASYDNSKDNPSNPDPTRTLTFGEQSTDEMMFGAFEFIPAEGKTPKPVNIAEKVKMVLADYPAESSYAVSVDVGFMKLPTAFVLPKKGEGSWFFPLGRQILEIPLSNIKWEANNFNAEVTLLGRGGIKISGSVSEDGAITGNFDMSGIQRPKSSEPQFGDGFQPKGFTGKRSDSTASEAKG